MGQRYEGTLIVQTTDQTSPTGNYVLPLLINQAEEGDIKDNKQGYDSVGNIVTGSNKGGYAGRIYSYAEMDSYLTEENVGRILTYMGDEESSDGGMTNAIQVGDVIDKLYFDTTVTPDFSTLDWGNYDHSPDTGIWNINFLTFEASASSTEDKGFDSLFVQKRTHTNNGETEYRYALAIYGWATLWTNDEYAHKDNPDFYPQPGWNTAGTVMSLSANGVFDCGQFASQQSGINVVKAVRDQNLWSSYISKDGQWSDNTPKYVTGQTYQVVKDGETIEFKAIRY